MVRISRRACANNTAPVLHTAVVFDKSLLVIGFGRARHGGRAVCDGGDGIGQYGAQRRRSGDDLFRFRARENARLLDDGKMNAAEMRIRRNYIK